MYEYVRGKLVRKDGSSVVIETSSGAAYRCLVPVPDVGRLPQPGEEVRLWTHGRISEERWVLYGFTTEADRDLFETIVATVPALGPRRALAILSSIGARELLEAVERGDVQRLRRTRGIGEKLASRLIVELRGRLPRSEPGNADGDASIIGQATAALVSLGYGRREADEAVARARKEAGPSPRLEELIKRSLEHV